MTETTHSLIVPSELLTMAQYAEHVDKSVRTIKRYLAADELPGAVQDAKTGQWRIPADAVHTPKAGEMLTMTRPGTSLAVSPPPATELTPLTSNLPPELTPELIDRLPTFLTLPQAAYLLGISEYTIQNKDNGNRAYFKLRRIDRHLMMPLSRLKKLRGIS